MKLNLEKYTNGCIVYVWLVVEINIKGTNVIFRTEHQRQHIKHQQLKFQIFRKLVSLKIYFWGDGK